MVIRFKESIRVRVWGRELSNFRKGEIHAVPTAVAGVLLAQGCAEPMKYAIDVARLRRTSSRQRWRTVMRRSAKESPTLRVLVAERAEDICTVTTAAAGWVCRSPRARRSAATFASRCATARIAAASSRG